MTLIRKIRHFIRYQVLGTSDTPHRVAAGVFLGFLVAWTPTIGVQIAIYVALATLLRVNKVVGVPILFISNPLTAVPLYYFVWLVGSYALHCGVAAGGAPSDIPGTNDATTESPPSGINDEGLSVSSDWWSELGQREFWQSLGQGLLDTGAELWVGALILGITTGLPAYFLTLWGLRTLRERRRAAEAQ